MSDFTMSVTVPETRALSGEQASQAVSTQDPMAARQFAIEVARVLADVRCHQISILDVSGISPITDFLVLASGTSPRQMKSASDAAEEFGETVGYKTLSRVVASSQWIVEDFVDVIVHVFSQDARYYYDLDSLWGDARRVEWEQAERERAGA